MIVIYVLLGLIVSIALWILLVPVKIELNFSDQKIHVVQPLTFSLVMTPTYPDWVKVHIFGLPMPINKKARPHAAKKRIEQKRSGFERSPQAWKRLMRSIVQSFRLESVWLNVDTGDVITNAKLVPVAFFLSAWRKETLFQINYNGMVEGWLKVRVTLATICWGVIIFLTAK